MPKPSRNTGPKTISKARTISKSLPAPTVRQPQQLTLSAKLAKIADRYGVSPRHLMESHFAGVLLRAKINPDLILEDVVAGANRIVHNESMSLFERVAAYNAWASRLDRLDEEEQTFQEE